MEVVNNASSSPSVSMVFPENDLAISSTSEIRLVATAIDMDDSLVGVQFFVNGKKYGEQIAYDKSKPMDNYTFGINWNPQGVSRCILLLCNGNRLKRKRGLQPSNSH